MIDKRKLVDSIEKYYLNGLTEAVKFNIKNNVLHIPFSTTNRDVVGEVTLPIELPNAFLQSINRVTKSGSIAYVS